MTPRIAPFDGTCIHIGSTNPRSRFGVMFRIAQEVGLLRPEDRLVYMGGGVIATTLTPDMLALFCERAGFKLSDMTADAASA
jgi:hypothetical protein